jgi:lipid II:glycine glycyltransferase (peptidoglycan interpeptide bridge formation enzyme)
MKNNISDLSEQSLFATHVLSLDDDLDELFKSFHNSSVRRRIRKAEKNNLRFRISENEQDLKAFYKLEVNVRKKHGLPPQPYSFFINMWRYLKPKNLMFLPLVEYNNKVIAASIMLKYKDTFYYEYSASDYNYLNPGPNQKLIWEIIKIAHKQGAKKFDFGRSSLTNKSLIEFKKRWGTREQLLHYYYFPNVNKIYADNSDKILHRLISFVNRHLPLPLLKLEGKLIYNHLG